MDFCCTNMDLACRDYVRQDNELLKPQANLPSCPPRTIIVSALPALNGEPAEPPAQFALRACLLVDCVGSTPPQIIGIKTEHMATLQSAVPQVAAVLGIGCIGGVRRSRSPAYLFNACPDDCLINVRMQACICCPQGLLYTAEVFTSLQKKQLHNTNIGNSYSFHVSLARCCSYRHYAKNRELCST